MYMDEFLKLSTVNFSTDLYGRILLCIWIENFVCLWIKFPRLHRTNLAMWMDEFVYASEWIYLYKWTNFFMFSYIWMMFMICASGRIFNQQTDFFNYVERIFGYVSLNDDFRRISSLLIKIMYVDEFCCQYVV